jgi:RNA polymerase sigma-70 factor (ECF subfamily)
MLQRPVDAVTFTPGDRAFVLSVVRRLVGSEDAQDLTQDALLLAYRRRAQFRAEARYHTWLYRIAATTALSYLRTQRRRAPTGARAHPEPPQPSAVERLETAEELHHALCAFARLPARYQDVLELRLTPHVPDRAIAATLGVSVANVKILVFRGRQRLRAATAMPAA